MTPDSVVSGQHRYVVTYTLPDAQLADGVLALDIIGTDGVLETDRVEVVVTGLELRRPDVQRRTARHVGRLRTRARRRCLPRRRQPAGGGPWHHDRRHDLRAHHTSERSRAPDPTSALIASGICFLDHGGDVLCCKKATNRVSVAGLVEVEVELVLVSEWRLVIPRVERVSVSTPRDASLAASAADWERADRRFRR